MSHSIPTLRSIDGQGNMGHYTKYLLGVHQSSLLQVSMWAVTSLIALDTYAAHAHGLSCGEVITYHVLLVQMQT